AATARKQTLASGKAEWAKELAREQRNSGTPIHPARLLNEIARVASPDTIFVTDVGWNKNGAGQQLIARQPQRFITSGGMATMGFAPPAAIGAKIAAPDRPDVSRGRRRSRLGRRLVDDSGRIGDSGRLG